MWLAANTKIREILINVKETSDKTVDLESRINANNTQKISTYEELKRKITSIEKSIDDLLKTAHSAIKTATEGMNKRLQNNEVINEVNVDLSDEDLK